MRVLAVIPARGGSKGVPRKNLATLAGEPLVVHTIRAALACRSDFVDVIVSTEDEEVAAVAHDAGASVPFMRPAHLAGDRSASIDVIRHAIEFVERRDGLPTDWVMTLQPTAPLRSTEDIRGALAAAEADPECDSVISVVQLIDSHPVFAKKIVDGRLIPFCVEEIEGTRRQDVEPHAFKRNGAIYLTRRDVLVSGSVWGTAIRPYVMPPERSVNIDSPLDLELARIILNAPSGGAS
jgi:CMP-N-acetylneuraminic acid synthetase